MDGRTLIRMRLAFVGLAVALLLPLALLVRSAAARLEEQRRLKHEVVAERIFDEMERELAALLERERARPSGAYGATQTRAETWAPFMVGYFTHDIGGAQVTASAQLTAQRAALVASAARQAWQQSPHAVQGPGTPAHAAETGATEPVPAGKLGGKGSVIDDELLDGALIDNAAKRVAPKQEAVLRQLNRASATRSKRPAPASEKKSSKLNAGEDDPLMGMDSL